MHGGKVRSPYQMVTAEGDDANRIEGQITHLFLQKEKLAGKKHKKKRSQINKQIDELRQKLALLKKQEETEVSEKIDQNKRKEKLHFFLNEVLREQGVDSAENKLKKSGPSGKTLKLLHKLRTNRPFRDRVIERALGKFGRERPMSDEEAGELIGLIIRRLKFQSEAREQFIRLRDPRDKKEFFRELIDPPEL